MTNSNYRAGRRWWISFACPERPLGVVIVHADSEAAAINNAYKRQYAPAPRGMLGLECLVIEIPATECIGWDDGYYSKSAMFELGEKTRGEYKASGEFSESVMDEVESGLYRRSPDDVDP